MITVVDNCIPTIYQNHIENLIVDVGVPLFWHKNTSYNHIEMTDDIKRLYKNNPIVDNGQMVYSVANSTASNSGVSPEVGILTPILYVAAEKAGVEIHEVLRIKVNLLLQDKTFTADNFNFPHIDILGSKSFIYYVNDSDGDTIIFNESFKGSEKDYKDDYLGQPHPVLDFFDQFTIDQRVSPKKGRGVFFESDRYHASSNPSKNAVRFVINYNFI